MSVISVVGIDLAKDVFQLHGNDVHGKAVLRKKLRRSELRSFMAQLPPCLIGLEACGGSHHWAREFQALGHTVRLIAPQFVKPFVKSQKNDSNDAEAIAEAVSRPSMRFVPIKQIWQQDILSVHRIRERLMNQRTALMNEIRGLLSEYGIAIRKGVGALRNTLPGILEGERLSFETRVLVQDLLEELSELETRIKKNDERINRIFESHETCRRIQAIEGIGPITATALVASVGDPKSFKNGRQFSAWLGLVPRQNSSGGKAQLGGISKRGDRYLRKLLVHGARSAIQQAHRHDHRRSRWVLEKVKTRGMNRACVALANHTARVVWALLARGEEYRMI